MAKLFNGSINFPSTMKPTGAQPLDDRSVVKSLVDLLSADTFGTALYNGMMVSVVDEQKVYMLVDDTKSTQKEGWVAVGSGNGSLAVDTYEEAIELATADNIGQIIYVKTKSSYDADGEEGEGAAIEYDAAPYIVIGAGSLMKLAASSASGDIESDVRVLITKVSTLETTVGNSENGLVKDIETLETELDTFVNTTAPATYATNEALSAETATRESAISGITDTLKSKVDVVEGSRLMTNTEGVKLEGIAEGAQVNVIEVVKVNGTALTVTESDKSVDITVPTAPVQGVKSKSDGQILTLDGDKLDTTLTIAYVPASKGENDEHIPAQLRLQGVNDTVISSINADKFVKDGMIETVALDGPKAELGETGKKYLVITWNTESGKDVMRLDVSDLFNPYTAENGVQLSDGKFSIKLATGEQYLSVGTDGLTTTTALWDKVTELDNAVLSAATAYTDSSSAQTLKDAKDYTDELAGNVYTKESADSTFVKTENFNAFSEELETKLEGIAEGAQVNVIEKVTVNGVSATIDTDKNANVTINSNDVRLGTNITSDDKDVYTTTNTLSEVLQGIQNSITVAVSGGLTSITPGEGIAVSAVAANTQTVSIKVSQDNDNLIKISETDNGIFAAMYYGGDDAE